MNPFNMFKRTPSLEKLVDSLGQLPIHTADLGATLGKSENHLVFHYGPRLRKANKIIDGFSLVHMTLWNKNPKHQSDGIPALAMSVREQPKAKIAGDLYLMSTEEVTKLDFQLQNGIMFKRRRLPVLVPCLENKTLGPITKVNAFMYVAMPSFWHKVMDWDLNFYRGRGNFQVASVQTEPAADRQIQIGNYYRYSPCATFPESSVSTHLRSEGNQMLLKAGDAADRERADHELKLNPTPQEPRRFIHITSNEAEQQQNS
jgi:hypothetical protein